MIANNVTHNKQNYMPKTVVAITGGIATGKSYISNIFRDLGHEVLSADSIAKDIVAMGTQGHKQLKESFADYFNGDILDRAALKEKISIDASAKKTLDSITHPLIFSKLKKLIDTSNNDIVIIEVPLLFEAGFDSLCNYTICAFCTRGVQLKRLVRRDNIAIELANNLIDLQMNLAQKSKMCNFVIDTTLPKEKIIAEVENIIKIINNLVTKQSQNA